MTSPVPVPPQAITAAVEAVMVQRNLVSEGSREWATRIVTGALAAAAPHLAAAERERCAQLADERRAGYVVLDQQTGAEWRPFASLLREARP